MIHPELDNLETQIRRAVTSLAGRSRRKQLIQEELLAHLSSVYEQELSRLGDSKTAADATIVRFGSTDELRDELQASVPLFESMIFSLIHRKEYLMSRWWIVGVVAILIGFAVVLPESADFVVGALAMLVGVGLVRFCQSNRVVSRALRPLWGIIAGSVAVLLGPTLVLPVLAKIKHADVLPGEAIGFLVFGMLITFTGLALIAHGVHKNLRIERV